LSTGFITYSFNYIILRNIGAYGIAAFSVIMYINNLVISTMIAVNQAMQPLVSYYNGKKNLKKTQSLLIFSLTTAVIWGLIFFVSSQLFTDQLVSLFILPSNTEAYQIAVSGLRIFSFSFLLIGVNVILSGYFTALRFTRKATIVSMSRGYIFIALSLIILPTYFGDIGIWGSAIISEILTLGIALSLYLSYAKAKVK
ncbi:MAG: MATE family efflux transporter, partial [Firmicutes bacterium]|nr:MATE family efflux transporter [Bacillota bacterium]